MGKTIWTSGHKWYLNVCRCWCKSSTLFAEGSYLWNCVSHASHLMRLKIHGCMMYHRYMKCNCFIGYFFSTVVCFFFQLHWLYCCSPCHGSLFCWLFVSFIFCHFLFLSYCIKFSFLHSHLLNGSPVDSRHMYIQFNASHFIHFNHHLRLRSRLHLHLTVAFAVRALSYILCCSSSARWGALPCSNKTFDTSTNNHKLRKKSIVSNFLLLYYNCCFIAVHCVAGICLCFFSNSMYGCVCVCVLLFFSFLFNRWRTERRRRKIMR